VSQPDNTGEAAVDELYGENVPFGNGFEAVVDMLVLEVAADDGDVPAFAARASDASSSPYGELSAMVLPDGTPIEVPETVQLPEEPTEVAQTAQFHRTDLDILPEMQELAQKNPDTVGWISISGTVHLPVVYRDNTFYLDHDFTGAKNASGTLFLDENSPVNADTQNLLIHGHSMNDGSMFGILTHYRKLDFVKQHPMIAFSTLWERESYAVFAVLQVSSRVDDANYFNYFSSPTFASASDFDAYIDAVEARSMFQIPVDVEPDDALLTLSTCLDDDRLVVLARRLRPGESKDAIVSAVEEAYKS
jgi:sortase B